MHSKHDIFDLLLIRCTWKSISYTSIWNHWFEFYPQVRCWPKNVFVWELSGFWVHFSVNTQIQSIFRYTRAHQTRPAYLHICCLVYCKKLLCIQHTHTHYFWDFCDNYVFDRVTWCVCACLRAPNYLLRFHLHLNLSGIRVYRRLHLCLTYFHKCIHILWRKSRAQCLNLKLELYMFIVCSGFVNSIDLMECKCI